MPFQTTSLGWKASGVEPPASLKERGWEAQQKPPAPYFNWMFHLVDQALLDLRTNAVHKEIVGKANGIAKLGANGKVLNADGTAAGEVTKKEFDDHKGEKATVQKAGHVQLSDAVTSTDTTKAATPNAVKKAYDRADQAFLSASNGKSMLTNAITGTDPKVVIPAEPSFGQLATAVRQIKTGYIQEIKPGNGWIYLDLLGANLNNATGGMRKILEIKISKHGTYRVRMTASNGNYTSGSSFCQVYVNNNPRGIERENTSHVGVTYLEDILLAAGDLVQVYARTWTSPAVSILDFGLGIDTSEFGVTSTL